MLKSFFTEYSRRLWMRILVFAVLGMGWDVFMTTVQKIIGGQIDRNAIQTASTWMYLVYGSIPLVVFPMEKLLKKLHIPKLMGLVLFFLTLLYSRVLLGSAFSHHGYSPMGLQLVYTRAIQFLHGLYILSSDHHSFMGYLHCHR